MAWLAIALALAIELAEQAPTPPSLPQTPAAPAVAPPPAPAVQIPEALREDPRVKPSPYPPVSASPELRDPFDAGSTAGATQVEPPMDRVGEDLRDPFSQPGVIVTPALAPARDLRDPFAGTPAPIAMPPRTCPDSGAPPCADGADPVLRDPFV